MVAWKHASGVNNRDSQSTEFYWALVERLIRNMHHEMLEAAGYEMKTT
jgi:hypothetical protein